MIELHENQEYTSSLTVPCLWWEKAFASSYKVGKIKLEDNLGHTSSTGIPS